MNDEMPDDLPEGSMIYMNLPPEVRAMMEHQKLHAQDNAHEALNFLDDLDEDQLKTLRGIISGLAAAEDSIPYYIGLIGGLLQTKFSICLGCGSRHDDELAEMTGDGRPQKFMPESDDEPERVYTLEQFFIDCKNYEVQPLVSNDVESMVLCTGLCYKGGGTRGTWDDIHVRMERPAGHGGCDFCVMIEKHG